MGSRNENKHRSAESLEKCPPKKCSAHSSQTGEPCKQYAIPGTTVCHWHGGNAPATRDAARRRLAALVPDALTGLEGMAGLRTLDEMAKKEEVRLRALMDILDRAGLKPTDKVQVTEEPVINEALDEAIAKALDLRLGEGDGS